ncbi:MAG: Fic family protein [Candidatus Aenigmarchaeota archaeon]|nr:Fic family protein [Candidatus Aenigmarchaeota archaeon]
MKFPKKPPKKIEESKYVDNLIRILRKHNNNHEFKKIIKDLNEKYYYWEKLLYMDTPKDISKEDIWFLMKFERNKEFKEILIGDYKFKFNLTNYISKKLHEFDLNLGGNLTNDKLISSDDKDRFLLSSILEESINSSRLEGASTTIEVAKDMILNKKRPKDKNQKMILNNYLGMRKILDLKGQKLTKEILFKLHRTITQGTLEKDSYVGKFRETNEIKIIDKTTGDIFHTPPNYEELDQLIEDFCDFYNNEQDYFIHPIVKANILHFLFGFIHPFYDGNGRTGRIINILYLILEKLQNLPILYLSRYIIQNKSDYYRLLQEVREKNSWEEWILFMIKAVESTSKETIDLIIQIRELMMNYKHKLRENYKFYSQDLLNNLFKHPYTKIEFVVNDLNVSRITAANYLNKLADDGLLKKEKIGTGNYYVNKLLFDLLVKR